METLARIGGAVRLLNGRLEQRATEKAAAAQADRPLNLKPVELPPRHGSINIGWIANNGAALNIDPAQVQAEGYDGVLIRPAIPGSRSTLYCSSHDGITLTVGRRANFVVQLEDIRLEAGFSRGTAIGQQNQPVRPVDPGFEFRAFRCEFVAHKPQTGRTKWLVFGYQFDGYFRDCVFDGLELSEHDFYAHGSAGQGWMFVGCRFSSSGAEQIKVRSDATETAYAGRDVRLIVRDCSFHNWHQTWSDRGGAAIVVQGGALHGFIERCVFRGGLDLGDLPANARGHCIMVSSEGESYDIDTGAVGGTGFGNGHWLVRDCALWAHSDVPWRNDIIRFGRNGGSQRVAKSVRIERCGVWGQQVVVTATNVGGVSITGCNTSAVASYCRQSLNMDTSAEARFPTATRLVPLSEGISR